jgi:nucleotide-binding universal stress UspA family protein
MADIRDEFAPNDIDALAVSKGRVVVGVDDAPVDERRAELLFAAGEANHRGSDVLVLHGCEPLTTVTALAPGLSLADRRRRGEELVAAAVSVVDEHLQPGLTVRSFVSDETGAMALIEASRSASLLVLQRRRISTLRRWHTGSTTARVCAQARSPVAVVTSSETGFSEAGSSEGGPRRTGVVVAVDARGHSTAAMEFAFTEASLRGEPLIAVHAWTPAATVNTWGFISADPDELAEQREQAAVELSEALAGYSGSHPDVQVRPHVVAAPSPTDAVLDAAKSAQLLVVGRHAQHRTASYGLGSVARHCLAEAQCPVIVTPTTRPSHHVSSWATAEVTIQPL